MSDFNVNNTILLNKSVIIKAKDGIKPQINLSGHGYVFDVVNDNVVIDGLSITGGNNGGIYVSKEIKKTIVTNCNFHNNVGVGAFFGDGNIISNYSFHNNQGRGATFEFNNNITNCSFYDNSAQYYGGVLLLSLIII